jgi:hypothetical protein
MSRQSPIPGAEMRRSRRGGTGRAVSLLAMSACAALLLLSACDSARRPSEVNPKPVTQAAPEAEPPLTDFSQLPMENMSDFDIQTEGRSKAVLEHYDKALKEKGWKRKESTAATGKLWEWDPVPPSLGLKYSDELLGAWVNPDTGETAVLELHLVPSRKGDQEGSFDIYPKDDDPWSDDEE